MDAGFGIGFSEADRVVGQIEIGFAQGVKLIGGSACTEVVNRGFYLFPGVLHPQNLILERFVIQPNQSVRALAGFQFRQQYVDFFNHRVVSLMIQLLLDKPLRCAPDNSGIVNDTGVALEIADGEQRKNPGQD